MKCGLRLAAGILGMLMLFSGCGKSPANGNSSKTFEGSSNKDTLIISRSMDPGSMQPYDATGTAEGYVQDTFLETFFFYDEAGVAQPKLAESYEFSEDGMQLVIKIRKDVKFHNGNVMDMDDVLYSFQVLKDSSQGNAVNYLDFDNIKALDEETLQVPLKNQVAYATAGLTRLYIFDKDYMEEMGNRVSTEIIGTGPYVLKEYISGDSVTVEKFDDYWGEPVKLSRIIFRFIPEKSVAMIELDTGGVDFAIACLASDINKVRENPNGPILVYDSPALRYNAVNFNCASETLSDIRVRQALSYAVDKEAIIKGAYEGQGTVATSMVPSGTWGHNKELDKNPTYSYNPEKAKQLLAEAGYESGLNLRIVIDSSTSSVAEQLSNMFAAVGVTSDIQQYDQTTSLDILRNSLDWDISIRQYGIEGDPGAGLMIQTHPNNSHEGQANLSKTYDIPEAWDYAEKLEKAVAILDDAAREAAYGELQEIYMDNAFLIPLRNLSDTYLHNSSIKGFVKSGNRPIFCWCYFE